MSRTVKIKKTIIATEQRARQVKIENESKKHESSSGQTVYTRNDDKEKRGQCTRGRNHIKRGGNVNKGRDRGRGVATAFRRDVRKLKPFSISNAYHFKEEPF